MISKQKFNKNSIKMFQVGTYDADDEGWKDQSPGVEGSFSQISQVNLYARNATCSGDCFAGDFPKWVIVSSGIPK